MQSVPIFYFTLCTIVMHYRIFCLLWIQRAQRILCDVEFITVMKNLELLLGMADNYLYEENRSGALSCVS